MPSIWFSHVLRAFWVGFGAAAILAYPIYQTLLRLKSRQTVSEFAPEGHRKKQGTPTMGGLIIVAGGLVAMLLAGFDTPAMGPAVVLLLGFAAIGFIDDFVVPRVFTGKRGLGWKQKILMQLLVAGLGALWLRGRVDVELVFTVFLILFFSNAYNFSDGLDGLAGGLLLAFGLGLLACGWIVGASLWMVVPVAALVGAAVPFLFINAPPARVFMGDAGSLPVGALLGYAIAAILLPWRLRYYSGPSLAAYYGPLDDAMIWAFVVLSLMMVVELVPVPLQILSVKIRKKRLFPYTPIHHAFEKAGWPESRVVWHFVLAQLLCSALAVAMLVGFPRIGSRPSPGIRATFNR